MTNYHKQSIKELNKRRKHIDLDLQKYSEELSAVEKAKLQYERNQIERVLIDKIKDILDEG